MNRLSARTCMMGFLILLAALPSWCQKSGGPGKPGSGSGSSGSGSVNPAPVSSTPAPQPSLSPIFVKGRILMETGEPVPEPVSVALQCGTRPLQVIQSDLKGYFEFTLGGGGGAQDNTDFSASNNAPSSSSINGTRSLSSGASQSGGRGSTARPGADLAGSDSRGSSCSAALSPRGT